MAKLYLEGLELSIRAMVYFGGEKRVLIKFRRCGCFVEAATRGAGVLLSGTLYNVKVFF
jgi:hypothetical protein